MHANLLDWRGDLLFGGLTGFRGAEHREQGTGTGTGVEDGRQSNAELWAIAQRTMRLAPCFDRDGDC